MPTFGSLFAGIGGIDLGLERAGWTGRWQVEYEPFCQRVLERHWPDVQRYGDIYDVDWSTVEPVDLIAGGFPCQPFSFAGKQQRLADDRWLWPEFERCIRELRPRYVLVENVPGLLVGGGMDAVLGGLADLGYDAEWESIPAAAVGAPHLRYRVWIVAHANGHGHGGTEDARGMGRLASDHARTSPQRQRSRTLTLDRSTTLADASDVGRERSGRARRGWAGSADGGGALADADLAGLQGHGRLDPERDGTGEWPLGSGGGPLGEWWRTEPDVGRVASRFSAGLDGPGEVDGHPSCIQKARTAGVPSTERLRVLREHIRSTQAPSEPSRCALCGHPLSALPCRGACSPWYLGAGIEEAEAVRCVREGVLGLLPRQGQDVLAGLSGRGWSPECTQEVGRRVDRLRSLGNAVVPQVVEWIGRRIIEQEGIA